MLRSMPGAPDGLDVLHDVERVLGLPEDDALALFLWLAVRRVFTWARMPAGSRKRLRSGGRVIGQHRADVSQHAEELAAALDVLLELWTRPETVEPARVAEACDQVGRWAGEWGLMRTAVMFMEAAAAADPRNALRAMDAGLMCQRLGGAEPIQRAEQWFQRAFGLARVAKHSRKLLSIRALLAYGNLARETGSYPLAEKCYETAARRARCADRDAYYAVAHHNLLALAVLAGWDFDVGEQHFDLALANYAQADKRLLHLAHDYAALLIRNHLYSESLKILGPLSLALPLQRDQLLVNGSLAWAAAGASQERAFEEAAAKVLALSSIHREFASDALRDVAEGALLLGDRPAARMYAQAALRFAVERDNTAAVRAARHVLAKAGEEGDTAPTVRLPASERTVHVMTALAARLAWQTEPVEEEPAEETESEAPARRRSRPLCPAPSWTLWGGAEGTAGLAVLYEVEPEHDPSAGDSLALVLWRTLRRVYTRAHAEPRQCADLFTGTPGSEGARLAMLRPRVPELGRALSVFHALLHLPAELPAAQLADACDEVGRWAGARGRMRSAVFFTEAAAAVEPENALRAMDAGLACQRCGGNGLLQRAEQWFQRAFDLARTASRSRRLLTIRALLAYGNYARQVGEYELAQDCYTKALRRARRHGRWTYYAVAHHNLLGLAVLAGWDLADAEVHAEEAFFHYPKSDVRLPHFVHDYAALLIGHGVHSAALELLKLLLDVLKEPRDQLLIYGSLARAAGGAGRVETYKDAVRAVLALAPRYEEFAADALLYAAEGALLLRDRTSAATHAQAAQALGTRRNDVRTQRRAAALLAQISSSEPAPPQVEVPAQARTLWLVYSLRARLGHRASRRH